MRTGVMCYCLWILPVVALSSNNSETLLEALLIRSRSFRDIASIIDILKKYPRIIAYVPSLNPVNPGNIKRISSDFGFRFHPVDQVLKKHEGIDIAANLATPIHCTASGFVQIAAAHVRGYGNYIQIKHKYGFETRYGHLSKIYVKAGHLVKKGDIIGFIGSTGKSTGCHLHYEIRKYGIGVAPKAFLQI